MTAQQSPSGSAPGARSTPSPDRIDGVTLAILVVGLIPLAGLLATGDWPPGELAVGSIMVLFALRQFAFARWPPR